MYGMKRNILIVANGDAHSNATIAEAVKQTGRGLRHANSSREASEILCMGLEDVDLAIVDLDPGVHSLDILEALDYSGSAPPVIALTGLEEMTPIACRHGAAACLGKPFSIAQLARLIEDTCSSVALQRRSCDQWGHPRWTSKRVRQDLVPA
jgi:DNA-binding NtrC family response regulator